MAYQSTESPQHPDPVQMNVHFLRGISPGPLKVSIRTIRPGKQFDNLYAELYQHVSVAPARVFELADTLLAAGPIKTH